MGEYPDITRETYEVLIVVALQLLLLYTHTKYRSFLALPVKTVHKVYEKCTSILLNCM